MQLFSTSSQPKLGLLQWVTGHHVWSSSCLCSSVWDDTFVCLFVCLFVSRSSLRTPWPTAPSCSYLVVKTRTAADLLADQRTPILCMLLFRRITRYRINSRMNTHTRTQTHTDTQTHILKHTQTNTHRHTHTHVCSHKSTQWDCMLILQLLVVACSCMKALSQLLLWLALLTLLDWGCEMCAYFSSTNTHTHQPHVPKVSLIRLAPYRCSSMTENRQYIPDNCQTV